MLLSTFAHIKGIGPNKERYLWRQGITTWDKYPVNHNRGQLSLFHADAIPGPIRDSFQAFQRGDMSYFTERLPSHLLYRIPLSFPGETLFLDIETTGLSLYYDVITLVGWSVGTSYRVLISGQDETDFKAALAKAKVVVTFNGTQFDLKFLAKQWPDLVFPPVHVDLRYLAKRAGLCGGQKAIEESIGYKRNKQVEGMLGESAPILWHSYRRGDIKALKRLITYNHEDIEGMKQIFDHCVSHFIEKESMPPEIAPSLKFTSLCSRLKWAVGNGNSANIHLPDFSQPVRPLCNYDNLNALLTLQNQAILGVDLVSSEKRKSGCCVLNGNNATTCCLFTDDEIVRLAEDSGAVLVSIDSPLSIPKGRTSFFDDDPCRNSGIMRQCERVLKRRGINVYPCLIPSMQKLTRRGMVLAEKLRQRGIPVIESYPGAAQDIMMIPRKQAGLDYLVRGLREFGIRGDFSATDTSHDELDAITSAIVGLFFLTGKFEALGNPLEEYLIIPDLNGDSQAWLTRKVYGVAGGIELIDEIRLAKLNSHGYQFISLDAGEQQENILSELDIRANNLAREMEMSIDLLRKWLIKKVMTNLPSPSKLVVLGVSTAGDRATLKELFGPKFTMLASESVQKASGIMTQQLGPQSV